MLRAPGVLSRKPSDFDFIGSHEEYESWFNKNYKSIKPKTMESLGNKMVIKGDINCEFEFIESNKSSELLAKLVKEDKETLSTSFGLIPNLDLLFTLKSSHKYLKNSMYFWKTVSDYHCMKMIGAKVRPEYTHLLKLREKETYTYAHPKLTNQTKETFFSEDHGIKYIYDHDSIHRSVALYDRPAYLNYMKDNDPIKSDKNKFYNCSRDIQLAGVIEEACVLAIERSLVPFPGIKTPKDAWLFALSKVCSSITSGFFREFAYENILNVIKLYPENYWIKFNDDLANGVIIKL